MFLRKPILLLLIFVFLYSLDCKVIKIPGYEALPAPNGFRCKEAGFFPHKQDCKLFWYCEYARHNESRNGIRESIILDTNKRELSNIDERVKLYKCPEGYLYDDAIKFCQTSLKVKCRYPGQQRNEQELIAPWGVLNDFR